MVLSGLFLTGISPRCNDFQVVRQRSIFHLFNSTSWKIVCLLYFLATMAYRETSPLDGVRAFLDDGLQLWEPYDALQCCELGPTALQVTPSELVQDGQLPQILFSQSQKEVVPRRESLQIPQPQTFHIPSVPFVQKKFRKLAWAIMSISLLVILIIVLVVVLLKLRRSRVANSTDPSVGPLSPTGLSNASSIFQLPYVCQNYYPC